MSDRPATMGRILEVNPTEAELNIIARLRQIRGMAIIDSDSMTLWTTSRAEYCAGRQRPSAASQVVVLDPV